MAPALPVIGLTAHALPEERERCLEAGMVERVTKPVDTEVLVAVMLRYAGRGKGPESAGAASPAPNQRPGAEGQAGLPTMDWPRLLEAHSGRESFVMRLLHIALGSQADVPARLRAAAAARNMDDLVFVAHGFKGVAGSLQADAVQHLAARTVDLARAGDAQAVARAMELADQAEVLLAEIRSRIDEHRVRSGSS